ncbi:MULTISPECIES: hypothetical protein [Flammeovirga]|uniref:Lipoprotein n=1 Tax=Flammeovirga agarivorans TaxID=2726742 RepID=A0A7X8SPZ2_9BACT|nr:MULTISPECIES: hypothetical protein [Flammeovirga]NLR94227.1 hypothetical protein [Flammeovirga agarivorans]
MTVIRQLSLFIFFLVVLLSCSQNDFQGPNFSDGSQYYPIEEGWYITYEIDSILIDQDSSDRDDGIIYENSIQLMERIDKPYEDGFGHTNHRLQRYKRSDENQEWVLDSVWAVTYRDNNIIRYENGIPYIKLVNPIYDRLQWDQNAFNNQGSTSPSGFDLRYTAKSIGRFFAFDDKNFTNTAQITEIDIENEVTKSEEKKNVVYAKDIGKVYSEYRDVKRKYYELRSDDAELLGNPYCQAENINKEVITLGNGQRVRNPFFGNDPCEANPIYYETIEGDTDEEKQANIEAWIASNESGSNPSVIDWETQTSQTGDTKVYVVFILDPTYYNGFNEIGTVIEEKVIEYGILVQPGE